MLRVTAGSERIIAASAVFKKTLCVRSSLTNAMGQVVGKIDVEQAKYETVWEKDDVEIRRYDSAVAVETKFTCTKADCVQGSGNSEAFQRLAKYIGVFGTPENQLDSSSEKISMTAPVLSSTNKPEKISMTAPVLNNLESEQEGTLAFILPHNYTIENAPKPKNPKVYLREIPAQHVAAIRFSGSCDEKMAEDKATELKNILAREGIEISDETKLKMKEHEQYWQLARYNPPWTLPFKRTNDVLITVEYQR